MEVIILAGGSGTRLWPLSREYFPKQYIKFKELENKSLFQLIFLRALKITNKDNILIITNEKQKFLVKENIEDLGILNYSENNIILEPEAKNTLPAIILGIQHTKNKALFLPSDHLIENELEFLENIEKAKKFSNESLVIFGIKPTSPNCGYGYIKYKGNEVIEFKEKPDKKTAEEYLKKGYLWNSGIFLFDKKIFEEELYKTNSELKNILDIKNPIELYSKLPNDSIDFKLLEKSKNIQLIPLNMDWTDLGSFDSLYNSFKKNNEKNIGINVDFYNSSNNFVQSSNNKKIILQGIDNLIVVDTDDALLICKREESEKIKDIVKKLKEEKNQLCEFHTTIYRPWGHFTTLEEKENYKVKRLTVLPNKSLSLQSHNHRSEHWVVVEGEATITRDIEMFTMQKNESIYIPKKTKHRLENKTTQNLIVIETQSGEYLGEDDIERFEDKYGRN